MRFLIVIIAVVAVLMIGWHFIGATLHRGAESVTSENSQPWTLWPPKTKGRVFNLDEPAAGNTVESGTSSNNNATPTEQETEASQDQQQLIQQQQQTAEQAQSAPYELETKRLEEQSKLLEQQKQVLKQQQEIEQMKQNQMAPAPTVKIPPVTDFRN